jgi:hypothetical protein
MMWSVSHCGASSCLIAEFSGSNSKLFVWSYLQRRGSKQLENATPSAIEMGVVYIHYYGPSVIVVRVLVRLRSLVAQIEDKSMTKRFEWSYLQRRGIYQFENATPSASIEMGVVYINYKVDNVKVNNR